MNNLSWFLYFGDVFGNVSLVFGLAAGLTFSYVAFWFIATAMHNDSHERRYDKVFKQYPSFWYFTPVFVFAIMSAIFPSKETIYMIAASETAEMVITSEDGQEMINDVKNVIKLQLKKLQEPETKTVTE